MTATSSPIGRPSGRRQRLARERTEAMLRRQAQLESEVAEQLEPLLGPAGGPVGGTARAIWRRRRVDAYLALPPWRRAARTWTAWGRGRRAAAALALAALWTVACLPLRMLGLASLEVSQIGVAVIASLAPVAALLPPARRGRFARPLPEAAPPWRGSRHGRTLLNAGLGTLAVGGIVLGVLAVAGPGPASPPEGRITAAARQADVRLVDREVARLCGPAAVATVSPDGLHRYAVAVAGGGSRADVVRTGGFDDAAGRAVIPAGAAICPAP